jgi:hypothetical protein
MTAQLTAAGSRPVLPCAAAAAAAVAAGLAAATAEAAAAAFVRSAERQMQMQHQQLLRVRSDVRLMQQLSLHCSMRSAAGRGLFVSLRVCVCVCVQRAGWGGRRDGQCWCGRSGRGFGASC